MSKTMETKLIEVVKDWASHKGIPVIFREEDYAFLETHFRAALGMDEESWEVSETTEETDGTPEEQKFVGEKVFSLKQPIEWSEHHEGHVLAEYAGIEFSIYFSNLDNAIYYDRYLFRDEPDFYEKVRDWLQKITQE